jgi:hypothetical protein
MELIKCSYCGADWSLVIVFLVQQICVQGQSFQQPGQTLPLNLGAYRNQTTSPFSAALRPAAGTFIPKKAIGLYAENRFMLKRVADIQGAVSIPVQSILLSLSAHYRGTSFLSTQSIGAGIGFKLSPRLSTGINISSHWLTINSVAPLHSMVVAGGLLYKINEKVLWGIHIRKGTPTNKMQKSSIENTALIGGIGYTLNKQLLLAFEISASSIHQLDAVAGIEWWANDNIHFRAGVHNPLSNLFIGVGVKGKHETVNICLSSHTLLGYSGGLLLVHEF